jgi:MFS family permease
VSVVLGRASERLAPRYVLVLGIGALMVSAGTLIVVDSIPLLFVANLGYGIGFQAGHVAQSMMWANYYGRRHAGEIRGISLPLIFGLGAAAFPATGLIRHMSGVYTPAWTVSLITLAIAAVVLVTIRQPAKQLR